MNQHTALQRKTPMPRVSQRPRKCRACRVPFKPRNSMDQTCGAPTCLAKHARTFEMKLIRTRKREWKKRNATRSDWIQKVREVFNKFIRFRDKDKPCICCGEPLGDPRFGGAYDAGHYRSVGSARHMRFVEDNVHAQRKACNDHGGGRHTEYRKGLIVRIGLERVLALEADQTPRKYIIEDLQALYAEYAAKCRQLGR